MDRGRPAESFAAGIWSPSTEEDPGPDLLQYWRTLWTRRWTILAVFLATVVVVEIGTLKQKPVYQASGTLQIDPPRNLPNVYQIQPPSTDNYVATQSNILSGSELVSRVITQLHLPSSPQDVSSFRDRLEVKTVPNTRLIRASFESGDPKAAAQVVDCLFSVYLQEVQQGWSESTENLSSVLLNQLRDTKQKLEQSIQSLQDYAQQQQLPLVDDGMTPGTQDPDTERLGNLQSELAHVEAERIEKEARYKEARSGETAIVQDAVLDNLEQKQADLRQQEAKLSATYGPNYPAMLELQDEQGRLQQQEANEREHAVQQIGAEYAATVGEEKGLSQLADESRKSVEAETRQRWQYSLLQREVDVNKQLYEGLLQQVQQAGLLSQWQGNTARVVDPPKPPTTPIRPRPLRNLALGILGGLVLAVGVALLDERLHSTFTTADMLEQCLSLPLLAALPNADRRGFSTQGPFAGAPRQERHAAASGNGSNGSRANQSWFRLDTHHGEPCEDLAEALLDLRTSLLSVVRSLGARTILFTSAVPAEGKTTICSNVSIAMARLGKRVLVVEGDLRRPSLHRVFGLPNQNGMSGYLRGEYNWTEAIRPSGIQGVDIVTCGEPPRHPSELLSSERMALLLREASQQYDHVLVDSPTLLKITDGRILAGYADAVVLVVKSGVTPKALVKQAYAGLRSISANVVGVVLNRWDLSDPANYSSHYRYSYRDEGSEPDLRVVNN